MGSTTLFNNAVFIRPEQVVRFLLCTYVVRKKYVMRVAEEIMLKVFAAANTDVHQL